MKNRPFKQKFDRYFQEIRYWLYKYNLEWLLLYDQAKELNLIVVNSPGSPSLDQPIITGNISDRTGVLGAALGELLYRETMLGVVRMLEESEYGPLIDCKRDCFPKTRGRRANTYIKRKLAEEYKIFIEASTIDKQWRELQTYAVMYCFERGIFNDNMRTRYEQQRAVGAKHLSGI